MDPIQKKRADRLKFLNALYDLTDQHGHGRVFDDTDVGAQVGLSEEETEAVSEYLSNERLIERIGFMGSTSTVRIAHQGIRQIEEARSAPERATHYFPPFVSVQVRDVHVHGNGQVMIGSPGASQSMRATTGDLSGVRDLVEAFAAAVRASSLPDDVKEEVELEAVVVQAQAKSPRPKLASIAAAVSAMHGIAVSAGGLAQLGATWGPQLHELVRQLGK